MTKQAIKQMVTLYSPWELIAEIMFIQQKW